MKKKINKLNDYVTNAVQTYVYKCNILVYDALYNSISQLDSKQ